MHHQIKSIIHKYHWKIITSAFKRGIRLTLPLNIPSAFITGSVGKTTTCRMLAHILTTAGYKVGLSTTQGTFIKGQTIRTGDSSNCRYGSTILLDPTVDAAVFELARGGLIKEGIAFDRCTVSAVLNVQDNHLGLSGITSREQMAVVKSLVAQKAEQLVALNADDPLCLRMRDQVKAKVISLISTNPNDTAITEHCIRGGHAVILQGEHPATTIQVYKNTKLIYQIRAAEIKATHQGRYRPAIVNAMFATSLADGLKIPFDIIDLALKSFVSDSLNNPGRMNFIDDRPVRQLITWTDGPIAIAELASFVQQELVEGDKILMFCGMGDRTDQFLYETGRAVANAFDYYICFDDQDLRGRPPLQAAEKLREGLIAGGVLRRNTRIASSYIKAHTMALEKATPGDILVIIG